MSLKAKNHISLRIDNERDFNLIYVEINPTIRTGITRSKKEVKPDVISNLAIYETAKDSLTYFLRRAV